jgi:hypothetical protein
MIRIGSHIENKYFKCSMPNERHSLLVSDSDDGATHRHSLPGLKAHQYTKKWTMMTLSPPRDARLADVLGCRQAKITYNVVDNVE